MEQNDLFRTADNANDKKLFFSTATRNTQPSNFPNSGFYNAYLSIYDIHRTGFFLFKSFHCLVIITTVDSVYCCSVVLYDNDKKVFMFNKVVRCSSLLPQKSSHVFFADPPLGIQAHIDAIKDQGLRERAASLPTLITARWATSTSSKYEQGWKKWEDWCRRYPESRPRPATAFYVALYFNDLVLQGCKYGTLTTAPLTIYSTQ